MASRLGQSAAERMKALPNLASRQMHSRGFAQVALLAGALLPLVAMLQGVRAPLPAGHFVSDATLRLTHRTYPPGSHTHVKG